MMFAPRVNAYVLAADPAYLASSVASYYSMVDRIVVSFDKDHVSWSGAPVPVTECLRELSIIDEKGKLDYRPGSYSDPALHPMDCETTQRQAALDAASNGADWVLQLDGDEIMPDSGTFADMLARAAASTHRGLDYPSRWVYGHAVHGRWLESSSRWWRPVAGYPGPLAVAAGVQLRHARQADVSLFRVDFRYRNTDPWRSISDPVHAVVDVDAGVLHFSWARDEQELRTKARVSGHSSGFDWDAAIRQWRWRLQHPRLAVLGTPLRRRRDLGSHAWLRSTSLVIEPRPRLAAEQ